MRRRRNELTVQEREHRGRRAIMWGGLTLLVGFAVGCMVAFIPVALGGRIADVAASFELIVPIGTLIVCLAGLAMVIWGTFELVTARRRDEHHERPA